MHCSPFSNEGSMCEYVPKCGNWFSLLFCMPTCASVCVRSDIRANIRIQPSCACHCKCVRTIAGILMCLGVYACVCVYLLNPFGWDKLCSVTPLVNVRSIVNMLSGRFRFRIGQILNWLQNQSIGLAGVEAKRANHELSSFGMASHADYPTRHSHVQVHNKNDNTTELRINASYLANPVHPSIFCQADSVSWGPCERFHTYTDRLSEIQHTITVRESLFSNQTTVTHIWCRANCDSLLISVCVFGLPISVCQIAFESPPSRYCRPPSGRRRSHLLVFTVYQ